MKNTKNIHLPSLEVFVPQEVTIHYKRPLYKSMVHIHSIQDAVKYLRFFVKEEQIDFKEFFWILLLNRANRLIAFSEIGSGSDAGVVINHKEIFQLVLKTNASAIIVSHNHPSGQLKISDKDKIETFKLRKMADLISIRLLDHIIITSEGYQSIMEDTL